MSVVVVAQLGGSPGSVRLTRVCQPHAKPLLGALGRWILRRTAVTVAPHGVFLYGTRDRGWLTHFNWWYREILLRFDP